MCACAEVCERVCVYVESVSVREQESERYGDLHCIVFTSAASNTSCAAKRKAQTCSNPKAAMNIML